MITKGYIMDEYQQICETTKPLTDLKEHEELIYLNGKLHSLKPDVVFNGVCGGTMTIGSLVSLIVTIRNPEAINIMCTSICSIVALYNTNEARKEAKKYIQLKREIKNLQNNVKQRA